MEAWISLITLDSQTSSQIVSEKSLKALWRDLRKSDTFCEATFVTLANALGSKLDCIDPARIPSEIFGVCDILCKHLSNRKDLLPESIRNFFSVFVEPLTKLSPDSLVKTFECVLSAFYSTIIDNKANVFVKCSILAAFNEISILSSATKVELFVKQSVQGIYSKIASHLRHIGDYDCQTQLLEFLLHVIPAAKRKDFARLYLHTDVAEQFFSIVGQPFEPAARRLLNTLNPIEPSTQKVFSMPCTNIRLCENELKCPPSKSNEPGLFWVDFNMVPERITTYCVLPSRTSLQEASDDVSEPTWETISLYPEIIVQVNVSTIQIEVSEGTSDEQIVLSISTSESICDFFPGPGCESAKIIEFIIKPEDVARYLHSVSVLVGEGGRCSQSQHQLLQLLGGLKNYAQDMLPPTSQSSDSSSAMRRHPSGSTAIYASCKSPLCVDVGSSATAVALPPPPPPPKSFFRDPDVSFEESAEGMGLRCDSPVRQFNVKRILVACQTARTPLLVNVASTQQPWQRPFGATGASRSSGPPLSVASGLETPSPARSELAKSFHGESPIDVDDDLAVAPKKKDCSPDDDKTEKKKKTMTGHDPDKEKMAGDAGHHLPVGDQTRPVTSPPPHPLHPPASPLEILADFVEENGSKETPGKSRTRAPADGGCSSLGGLIREFDQLLGEEGKPPNATRGDSPPLRRSGRISNMKRAAACDDGLAESMEPVGKAGPASASVGEKAEVAQIDDNTPLAGNADGVCREENSALSRVFKAPAGDVLLFDMSPIRPSQEDLLDDPPLKRQLPFGRLNHCPHLQQAMTPLESSSSLPFSSQIGSIATAHLIHPSPLCVFDAKVFETKSVAVEEAAVMTCVHPQYTSDHLDSIQETFVPDAILSKASPERARGSTTTMASELRESLALSARRLDALGPLIESDASVHEDEDDKATSQTSLVDLVSPASNRLSPVRRNLKSVDLDCADATPVLRISQPCLPLLLMENIEEEVEATETTSPKRVAAKRPAPRVAKKTIAPGSAKGDFLFASPASRPRRAASLFTPPPPLPSPTTTATAIDSTIDSTVNNNSCSTLYPDTGNTAPRRTSEAAYPSPMSHSSLDRLEAALGGSSKTATIATSSKSRSGTPTSLFDRTRPVARPLFNATATYLEDSSPCPGFLGVLSQEEVQPNRGGLIAPILGNKVYNITKQHSKNASRSSLDTTTTITKAKNASSTRKSLAGSAAGRDIKKPTHSKPASDHKGDIEGVDVHDKVTDHLDNSQPLPVVGCTKGKRFFPSSFADRNKREAEKRFYEVISKKAPVKKDASSAGQKSFTEKRSRAGSRKKSLATLEKKNKKNVKGGDAKEGIITPLISDSVEEHDEEEKQEDSDTSPGYQAPQSRRLSRAPPSSSVGGNDSSGPRLQSRPAIRRAAAIARSRIVAETKMLSDDIADETSSSSTTSVANNDDSDDDDDTGQPDDMDLFQNTQQPTSSPPLPRPPRQTALQSTSSRSALGLFDQTPNNSAIYDITFDDDEKEEGEEADCLKSLLMKPSGPRLGRRTAASPSASRRHLRPRQQDDNTPIASKGFVADMNECISVFFSTLNLTETEFNKRLEQLRNQVEQLQRLVNWSQRRHSEAGCL